MLELRDHRRARCGTASERARSTSTTTEQSSGEVLAPTRRARIAAFPGLERNIIAVPGAMFLMGLGEELWKRFVTKYLEVLGAPIAAIGLYGTVRDFLDGVYQYPGGWVAEPACS